MDIPFDDAQPTYPRDAQASGSSFQHGGALAARLRIALAWSSVEPIRYGVADFSRAQLSLAGCLQPLEIF